MEREGIQRLEPDWSGDGPAELGQPRSGHQKALPQDDHPREDAADDRLHLPVRMMKVSTVEQAASSSSTERMSNKVEENHRRGSYQGQEGSASFPLSSD